MKSKTETTYIPLRSPDWQSERAIGIDGTLAEDVTGQTRRVRFFVPKSLLKNGAAPDWFIFKKAAALRDEWTGGTSRGLGGCFVIEGVAADGQAIYC